MKPTANYRIATPSGTCAWLPRLAPPRALDPSHWLSRAAHGHSWNAAARNVNPRRRPH